MARSLNKPVIRIKPQGRTYKSLTRLDEPITWKWKTINARLDALPKRRS